jgi:asparagine synthase (glutamine-hydrolysing)
MAADKMSMAHSLEIRMPFLDKGVIRFATGLPSALKIRKGKEKYALFLLARRLVPPEIFMRRKKGLVQPAAAWARKPLEGFTREFLLDQANSGPFNPMHLEQSLNRWLNPKTTRVIPIVRLLYFQSWWNEFCS